ncbi:MAG: carbon starvation protein A [Planctomycetes bacterium]|nr:carbon starvation protein A [Planctomycetota bacterium]
MPGYVYFFISTAALILGYVVYSRVVERLFGADFDRPMPADYMADGVDYVRMPPWKVFLIQVLNIAGVGPVFGPILGALYGPTALVWIVIGAIFAGGVHDYFSGMLSGRYHGKSTPDIVGYTLGNFMKQIMRGFAIVLLVLVGTVFVRAPADLLTNLTGWNVWTWIIIIFLYYFLATILPIDLIIGRLYPFFAVALIIMALGVAGGLIWHGYQFYGWAEWTNQHPQNLPIWPLLFVTIACGALSGFHATQSPMMARCITNEKHGRFVFYGGMIAEGIIALIWATAGMTFYDSAQALQAAGTPAMVVNTICNTLLGPLGGFLAIMGVVVLPVTSGDTAFRAVRLTIADILGLKQKSLTSRLGIAVPVFATGMILTFVDFSIIWRYFGWSNQTLATIVLWTAAAYLVKRGVNHWITSVPATVMTAVVIAYICQERIGFGLGHTISVWIGIVCAAGSLAFFLSRKAWFVSNVQLELRPAPDEK